jgi:cytochrome c-type biogenesis protein CcmE
VKPKHQRLVLISGGLLGLGLAAFLALTALRDNIVFFYTPSDLQHKKVLSTQRIRVGGLVESHSVFKEAEKVQFTITDKSQIIRVTYHGLLPDLFREGQGVVVEGHLLQPSLFQADTVMAKHDENYMPKDVADKLKEQGLWREK